MTDIEKQALALLNEVAKEMSLARYYALDLDLPGHRALCRAIERFNAFKQEVSDAVQWFYAVNTMPDTYTDTLGHLIIAKPDPLVEALDQMLRRRQFEPAAEVVVDEAAWLRAALAARGLEIREVGHD